MQRITSWSLQSPDATNWTAAINPSTEVVTYTSGGGVITAMPPVFPDVDDPTTIWTPSISNLGDVTLTQGTFGGQFEAALMDSNGREWNAAVSQSILTWTLRVLYYTLDEVALYNTELSLTQIQAHYAARLLEVGYASTVLADSPKGYWRLDESAAADLDTWSRSPIITELNGINILTAVQMGSVSIQDTLGQPVTANITFINFEPRIGDRIRIKFYEQVIFAGTIDHVEKSSPDLRIFLYVCDCLDYSQVLYRRKLRRNFTNVPIPNIIDSLLDNELSGEPIHMGTIQSRATVPLVDAHNASMFDVLRDVATATGQTMYLDFTGGIQMRGTPDAWDRGRTDDSLLGQADFVLDEFGQPIPTEDGTGFILAETSTEESFSVLGESSILLDGTGIKSDRETYRNVMTVIVTGTPAENQDGLTVTQQRRNEDQIAERAAIEGGTGIYEEIEEITHPTSNDAIALTLLGIGYARLRLATSGTLRQTISCQVRGYGFRAGQIGEVNLPTFGLIGSFIIQKVSIQERDGRYLFHNLELVSTSTQQRAYEAWLGIVKGGKVTVQMPAIITNNLESFITPGTVVWTAPAGITSVEITCIGGSGGGGGAARFTDLTVQVHKPFGGIYANGESDGDDAGQGGASGKAVTILEVLPGEELTLIIGSAGVAGASDSNSFNSTLNFQATSATSGTDGTMSRVLYHGNTVCQGDPGKKGTNASMSVTLVSTHTYQAARSAGMNGANGSGVGDAIVTGGGKTGGGKGKWNPYANPSAGLDGMIELRY